MKPRGFPKRRRVRRRADFLRIQGVGAKHHTRHFLVFVATPRDVEQGSNATGHLRLGITVTKKIGSAVVRNRVKRWVREAFRHVQTSFTGGVDMVWVAKRNAAETRYSQVMQQMQELASRVAVSREGAR